MVKNMTTLKPEYIEPAQGDTNDLWSNVGNTPLSKEDSMFFKLTPDVKYKISFEKVELFERAFNEGDKKKLRVRLSLVSVDGVDMKGKKVFETGSYSVINALKAYRQNCDTDPISPNIFYADVSDFWIIKQYKEGTQTRYIFELLA